MSTVCCDNDVQALEPVGESIAAFLPLEDLTAAAKNGLLPDAVRMPADCGNAGRLDCFDSIARVLHRRENHHVLLTGDKGVGKTTVVHEVARRAQAGEIGFLKNRRFVRIDCSHVSPDDSRAFLEALFAQASQNQNIVLCLDDLASVLKRPSGDNKKLLRSLLRQSPVRVIGILSRWEYNELIAGDAAMLELFARVEIDEPRDEEARAIAHHAATRLETEYDVSLDAAVVERAFAFASNFILNKCQPAKTIKVLRRACDELDLACC